MTTEEQFQSFDIQQTNGIEEADTHEYEEKSKTSTSLEPPVRRSRFFRSRRKQRFNEEQSNQIENHASELNESSESSESPQQHTEDISIEEHSQIDCPIKSTVRRRSISPPPPPPSNDNDDDEPDGSSSSEQVQFSLSNENPDVELQTHLVRRDFEGKNNTNQSRPAAPTIYAGYQRKKSQSVKLTRVDPLDAYPKKNVRFADDFGLDLSQIKMIKSDELPHVPSAAFKDLHINDESSNNTQQERMKTITYLEQRFENPIHAPGFDDRVSRHKVVLEQANAIDNRIYGTIKIISFGLNKRVKIRVTSDNWITCDDFDATYITDSFDGIHDRFTFTLNIPRDRICLGNNVQFCIGYESYIGPEYWDNNYQQNYRFECISRSIPDYSS